MAVGELTCHVTLTAYLKDSDCPKLELSATCPLTYENIGLHIAYYSLKNTIIFIVSFDLSSIMECVVSCDKTSSFRTISDLSLKSSDNLPSLCCCRVYYVSDSKTVRKRVWKPFKEYRNQSSNQLLHSKMRYVMTSVKWNVSEFRCIDECDGFRWKQLFGTSMSSNMCVIWGSGSSCVR